jgi:hypothetical protein
MTTMTTTPADVEATTAIGDGDILSVAQLRAEANRTEAVLEEFTALIAQIGGWANALPERYVAAPFGTEALSAAVNHVTEAGGDGTAISEALTEVLAALDEADGLGETVSELEADGRVDAFTES